MTGTPDTVYVVERDDDLRARLSGYLSASGFVVRGFSSAESFLESLPIKGSACVVVDQHLPGLSGPELQRKLLGNPALALVFVTDSGDVSTVVQAMKHGAVDFLMKPIEAESLIAAVTRGLQKGMRAESKRQLRDTFLSRVELLTARERQVAARLVAGRSNKQIASELGTTEKTAKVHRGHVMAKLQVGSVAELIRLAEETRPSPIVPPVTNGAPPPIGDPPKRSTRRH
jgi:FixJ family two-component response regulator